MKKHAFTRVMFTGLLVFLPIFLFSVFFLNPKSGVTTITTLLVSLFFSSLCLVALLGFALRIKKSNNEILHEAVKTSFREGLLVGLYAISILGLAAIKLLTWWDALLLALSLVLFEIYFKSSKETSL